MDMGPIFRTQPNLQCSVRRLNSSHVSVSKVSLALRNSSAISLPVRYKTENDYIKILGLSDRNTVC